MIDWITTTYLGKFISTMFMSMLPIIELRGGIPYGVGLGLPIWEAFLAAFLGNILPVPFILIFLRNTFNWLRTFDKTKGLVERLERKAHLNGQKVEKYRLLGLFILVAIPLPGTGAWTGALVASVLDVRIKAALPVIALGVLTAGLVVLFVTNGVVTIF
ncbi:MAG: COG2426 family protein [Anaerovoracaceae bacterium]